LSDFATALFCINRGSHLKQSTSLADFLHYFWRILVIVDKPKTFAYLGIKAEVVEGWGGTGVAVLILAEMFDGRKILFTFLKLLIEP